MHHLLHLVTLLVPFSSSLDGMLSMWPSLWYTQEFGYKAGSEITKDMSGGILKDITKGASILGMFILPFLYNVGYLSTLLLTFQVNNWLKTYQFL